MLAFRHCAANLNRSPTLSAPFQPISTLASANYPLQNFRMLLHYVASNGVELWRQNVPRNLPAICEMLLLKGANASAKMSVYGGYYDTLSLLLTSAHPKAAGLMDELALLLKNA